MDKIARGACSGCGNVGFIQHTIILLAPVANTFTDADGLKKMRAGKVRKMLECLSCGRRYLHRAGRGWTIPEDPDG